MKNKLDVDSIHFGYGKNKILTDIFITTETGSISGLLGRNGQGKTTLLNVIFGSLEAHYKSIRYNGNYISNPYKVTNLLNYLPQFNFIPDSLRIKTIFLDYNLDFSAFLFFFPDFQSRYTDKFHNLSGGEKRIIEIYVIVKYKTSFTILDEPFSYLMPKHIDTIKEVINSELPNKGFIITDHLYRHVLEISHQTYLLTNGKTYPVNAIEDLERYGYLIFNT